MSFFVEFISFMKIRKKYWLYPALIFIATIGGLLVLAKGSIVAPFIYTLF